MSLNDTLEALQSDVSDFVAASVVHREEGVAVTSLQGDGADAVDVPAADAYLAEMLRQHLYAQENLERDATTEDVLITTTRGLAIARPVPDTDFFWTLVAGPGANPTLTRAIMRKYHARVADAVAGELASVDADAPGQDEGEGD